MAAGYGDVVRVAGESTERLTGAERTAAFRSTAVRVNGLA
ncbi:hypothetical protein GCM10025734_11820 [Kitasatospora paranensis]